ncbi:MAG: hypothetical protein R2827_10860 [Bdellovibrionales bacterium]
MRIQSTRCHLITYSTSVFATEWSAEDVKPFVTDGCTASPDGSWVHCCYEHDLLYWIGGDFEARLKADDQLRTCMNASDGPGEVYYGFVRAGGMEGWGKAWPNNNRKQDLTAEEIELIQAERDLWISLGRPSTFTFVLLETTIFSELTHQQTDLLRDYFRPYIESDLHQEMVRRYIRATGELPLFVEMLH